MENHEQTQDNAPLRASSEEILIPQVAQRGSGSNRHAVKVAGLTVLACLLLSSQALMAYLVFSQRGQIHSLEKNADNMRRKLTSRPQVAPVQMHLPMNTMPLLMDFGEGGPKKTKTPLTKLEKTAVVSLEKQVKDLLQNSQLPQFNDTFLVNLKSLKTQMEEAEWKGFETWMRQWLIFQMAQQMPPPPPTPESASPLQTKCNLEASPSRVRPGYYQPQCDEQGHYKPMQCWHATGFCWCVDADGTIIPGTTIRGRPICDGAPAPAVGLRSMAVLPMMEKIKPVLSDE